MNSTNSATRRLPRLARLASCATLIVATALLPGVTDATVGYDIVYVRQPRYGDNTNTTWPEVAHPAQLEPGADLMLLHPDGSEEVLVPGGVGAVTDPFVSFDAQWVYYSFFYDVRPQALQQPARLALSRRGYLPHQPRNSADPAADLPRVHAQHRQPGTSTNRTR